MAGSSATSAGQSNSSGGGGMPPAFYWLATWLVIIVLFIALARSRWGQSILYWLLWLLVAFLILTHADAITGLFNIGNILQGQQ